MEYNEKRFQKRKCDKFENFKGFYAETNKTTTHPKYMKSKQEKIKDIWDGLLQEKNNSILFKKYGYIIIGYDALKNKYKRMPYPRGRCKSLKNNKNRKITIRLEEDLYKIFDQDCINKNITKTKAIRDMINKYLQQNEKTNDN